jgi:hypothetical protein
MFAGLTAVNNSDAASQHDGLVVAPTSATNVHLETSKISQQIGPAEFVVKSSTAKRAMNHDLQRGCNPGWLVGCTTKVKMRDRKSR